MTTPADRRPPNPGSPAQTARPHFPCLDAYRAIGMVMVLVNHSAYATGFIQRGRDGGSPAEVLLGPIIARFDIAVPMFFVLSGFLLYRPYVAADLAGRVHTPLRRFYRRRALRILPGYWAALAGLAIMAALSSVFTLGIPDLASWLGNLLVLPAFGVPVERCAGEVCGTGYGITQAWSIGVEVAFYLLLPVFAAAVARRTKPSAPTRLRTPLAAVALLWLAGTAFRVVVVTVEPSWAAQSLLWLPMYLDLFAVGMALATLSASNAEERVGLLRWCGDHPMVCWTGAGALLLLVSQMQPPPTPFGLTGGEYLPRQFAYGAISALWLAPAIFGDQRHGRLRHLLASRPVVFLGGISLSFYLWHLAFVEQAKAWTIPDYDQLDGLAVFQGSLLVVAGVAFVATTAVATVVWRLVEVPFLRTKEPRTTPRADADPPGSVDSR